MAMNTTRLIISHWNMSGAVGDVAERFRSGSEFSETSAARSDDDKPVNGSGFLVRHPDEDDRAPLVTD